MVMNKFKFMSFRSWLLNGWYYARFYFLAWFTNRFQHNVPNPDYKVGYEILFKEDFNEEIDWDKWHYQETNMPERETYLHDKVVYLKEQVSVKDGKAILQSDLLDQDYYDKKLNIKFKSGSLYTQKSMQTTYGYFEVYSMVAPGGIQSWPSFWFSCETRWPPEIDVYEIMGNKNSNSLTMSLHAPDYTTNSSLINTYLSLFRTKYNYTCYHPDDFIDYLRTLPWTSDIANDIKTIGELILHIHCGRSLKFLFQKDFLARGFHKYAIDWSKDRITWYLDNVAVYTLDKLIPDVKFYAMITHGVNNGKDGSYPTFPKYTYIDYFRAYKKIDDGI